MKPLRVEKRNSTFQVLLALKSNRAKRNELHELFVESIACIKAAQKAGKRFRKFIFNDYDRLSDWAKQLMSSHHHVQMISLERDLYEELCDKDDPSELVATIAKETAECSGAKLSERPFILAVDRPTNRGNLGATIRSANAFGVELLVTLGHGVDLFDPTVIRASMGGIFFGKVCHEPSVRRFLSWITELKQSLPGLQVLGTDSRGEMPLTDEVRVRRPAIVIMGNEAKGLSIELRKAVDRMIRIPMTGQVDSLNVACAATVVMYELARRPPR